MEAQEFYLLFRKHFDPKNNEKVNRAYTKTRKTMSQDKWTEMIDDVILNMSKEAGYKDTKEVKVSQGRLDHHWENDYDDVFIEHENIFRTVFKNEIPNLLNCDGSLRVLISEITTEEKREKLRGFVLEKLKSRKSGKNFEFLLILGTDTMMNRYDSWEAYSYVPTFEEYELI